MRLSARVRANRRNAQKSCGPRSAEGKRRASQNARKHGLTSPVERDPSAEGLAKEQAASLRADMPNAPEQAIRDFARAQVSLERIDHYAASIRAAPLEDAEAVVRLIRAHVLASRYEGEARARLRRAESALLADEVLLARE